MWRIYAETRRYVWVIQTEEGPPTWWGDSPLAVAAMQQRAAHEVHVEDHAVAELVDLAREGKRVEFDELAACVGVKGEELEALWSGTRRRLNLSGEG